MSKQLKTLTIFKVVFRWIKADSSRLWSEIVAAETLDAAIERVNEHVAEINPADSVKVEGKSCIQMGPVKI